MKENIKITNIRAIAIITVVLGHSIILYSQDWNLYETVRACPVFDCLKRFINLFQMPLFFSLSGYLFALGGKKRRIFDFIINKAKRLLVPFLSVGLLWMIPIKLFLKYPGYNGCSYLGAMLKLLTGSDLGHLWYLPTLFIIFLVVYFVIQIFGNKRATWLVMFITAIALKICGDMFGFNFGIVYITYFTTYFWSFVFGGIITKYKLEELKGRFGKIIIALSVVLSIAFVYMNRTNNILPALFIILTLYIYVPKNKNIVLEKISKNSFGLYLLHSPLIYITFTYLLNSSPIVVSLLNFFVFGGLAYLMTVLIRKTPMKLLIGG